MTSAAKLFTLVDAATPTVFLVCHRLKVGRVHARTDAAFVIQLQAIRDIADVKAVADDVRSVILDLPVRLFAHDDAVALGVDLSKPQPATTIRFRGVLGFKRFRD